MAGVPGTTADEQRRFANILSAAGLVDVWRQLHPAERGGWTWRCSSGWRGGGGAMRLDHFIVSNRILARVQECEAVEPTPRGTADARGTVSDTCGPRNAAAGSYFGSDHWPIWLRLSGTDEPADGAAAS